MVTSGNINVNNKVLQVDDLVVYYYQHARCFLIIGYFLHAQRQRGNFGHVGGFK